MSVERLQKVLARAGVASRRAAEVMIQSGRVRVDGRIVRELGVSVDPRRARVEVDGRRIVAEPLVYLVLHKPRGVMTTLSDPEGRPTIRELLRGVGVRIVPVGRLDFHTSGALLCTNDGEFAGRLLHPSGNVPKEYVAKVQGVVEEEGLERFRQSIMIDGRATRPAQVSILRVEGDKTWLSIVLSEGRNRQVRRLGDATGFPVMRLARTAHAGITTEGLRPGEWRYLSTEELVELKQKYGVPRSVRSAARPEPEQVGPDRDRRPRPRPVAKDGTERRPGARFAAKDHTDTPPRARPGAKESGDRRPHPRARPGAKETSDRRPWAAKESSDRRPRPGAKESSDRRPRLGAKESGDRRPWAAKESSDRRAPTAGKHADERHPRARFAAKDGGERGSRRAPPKAKPGAERSLSRPDARASSRRRGTSR